MSEHSLQLTHLFRGKLERVYRAWTNPLVLAKWFGPEGYKTTVLEFDPASCILTAYGRINGGTVRGDTALADRFLNLCFRI